MTSAQAFFDSNVVLYGLSTDHRKADVAERLLLRGGTVSVQVLNEVTDVARRKAGHSWRQVDDLIDLVCQRCSVVPVTLAIHSSARRIAEQYGFRIYDATIWAAALSAGCPTLYSEDMQHGQSIDGLTLVDPFR